VSKTRFGVAVVGAGNMGVKHMTAVSKIPWFEIRAVADVNVSLAEERAKKFGASVVSGDYREIVKRDDIDVVYVCVPAAYHAPVAVAAAKNGKHVYCEKPLALTLDDGQSMIAAAKEAGVRLAVGFQHRFREYFDKLRALLRDDGIGRPAYHTIYSVAEVRPNLAMHEVRGNGGPFVDVLCHYVDIWRFIFDSDPVSVFAAGATFAKGKPAVAKVKELAVDTGIAVVGFASGDVGCFQTSWGLPPGTPGVNEQQMITPNALFMPEPFAKFTVIRNGGQPEVFSDLGIEIQPLQNEAAKYFATAIRDGTPPRTTGEDGLIALKVSLAFLKSVETGQRVALDV